MLEKSQGDYETSLKGLQEIYNTNISKREKIMLLVNCVWKIQVLFSIIHESIQMRRKSLMNLQRFEQSNMENGTLRRFPLHFGWVWSCSIKEISSRQKKQPLQWQKNGKKRQVLRITKHWKHRVCCYGPIPNWVIQMESANNTKITFGNVQLVGERCIITPFKVF